MYLSGQYMRWNVVVRLRYDQWGRLRIQGDNKQASRRRDDMDWADRDISHGEI